MIHAIITMSTKTFLHSALLATLLFVLASSANATPLYYESFNYAPLDSSLNGASGGTGFGANNWSVSGTGSITNNPAAGLSYSNNSYNLNVAGKAAHLVPTNTTQLQANRDLGATFGSSTETTYLSFLINVDEGTRFLGLSLVDTATESLFIGQGTGFSQWRVSSPVVPGTNSTVAIVQDISALLVVRIDFNASGTNERVRLFVNPTLGVAEPGTSDINVLSTSSFTVNSLRLWAGYTNGVPTTATGWIDEVRIGTTWNDVVPATPVPEPSAASILIIGALFIGLFTRR